MNKVLYILRVEKASTRTWGHLTPKSLVMSLMLLFLTNLLYGQIETMYSLYRFNPQVLTPVQAGSTTHSEMILMYRNQWSGFEGAPRNLGFTGNFKWGQKKGIGLGALLDEAGPVRSTILSSDFAYHVKLSDNWNLDGGIRLGVANIALNFSQIRLINPSDNLFAGDRSTGLQPNLGWGFRFAKKDDGFFVSLSQPRIIKYDFGTYSGAFKDVAYYYAMMGTKIGLGGNLETSNGLRSRVTLYPSILFRLATDTPLSYDVNLTANLKGKLDVGLSYRRADSYGFRLGVQATPRIYLGYVYELPISEIRRVSSQTHEMAVRFSIFDKNKSENKGELKIEPIEGSNKVRDFGPYEKKTSETNSQSMDLKKSSSNLISNTKENESQTKQSSNTNSSTIESPSKSIESGNKNEVINRADSKQSSPPVNLKQDNLKQSTPEAKKNQEAVLSPKNSSNIEANGKVSEEEEYEYVTVTKTRIVRNRPKSATSKTVKTATKSATSLVKSSVSVTKSSALKGANNIGRIATKNVKSGNKPKMIIAPKPKATSEAASSATRSSTSNENVGSVTNQQSVSAENSEDTKITRKRISGNITETIVEKKIASEAQVGVDKGTKISKRRRKDGTEEVVYTTTEVVKRRKKDK